MGNWGHCHYVNGVAPPNTIKVSSKINKIYDINTSIIAL